MGSYGGISAGKNGVHFDRALVFGKQFDREQILKIDITTKGAANDHHLVELTATKNGKIRTTTKLIQSSSAGMVFNDLENYSYPVKLFEPEVKQSQMRDKFEEMLAASQGDLTKINTATLYYDE